ncbi:hypothetical protein B0H17DRAFT_1070189 [Mycena rosella]|uniref:Uncharacterized protein n=1 Tax=Mycena rosella TaxID=1033263 RepID=A0AAD7GG81_MYCRO|nr:hypothetical protein B0H17DRAFT_1070189 [Mycena rosella]
MRNRSHGSPLVDESRISSVSKKKKHLHRPTDTIVISPEFSFDHMLQYLKLAVAFAVDLTSYRE